MTERNLPVSDPGTPGRTPSPIPIPGVGVPTFPIPLPGPGRRQFPTGKPSSNFGRHRHESPRNVRGGQRRKAWLIIPDNRRNTLQDALEEIADELRSQYSLGYYPAHALNDGKWHRIEMKLKNRDYNSATSRTISESNGNPQTSLE